MEKYAVVKLVEWAGDGGLIGRKRLQKVVFFLQHAGCPFGANFSLHHYGPYSRDVAETCDELATAGLLDERVGSNSVGTQYTYSITALGTAAIKQSEYCRGELKSTVESFQALAERLLKTELWELELGSTILFFQASGLEWSAAVAKACDFKKIDPSKDPAVGAASSLAKSVLQKG